MIDERNSFFVCSRGLLKNCDIFSKTPYSSIRYMINYPNFVNTEYSINILYVCSSSLMYFIRNVLPKIKCKLVLVSGDCDETIPGDVFTSKNEFEKFIQNDLIVHWYCQNFVGTHEKVTIMPIGLDYHTMTTRKVWGNICSPNEQENMLLRMRNTMTSFDKRKLLCYSNYHFSMKTKYGKDRQDAYQEVPRELVYYEPIHIERLHSWEKQIEYAFVISPHGNGLDCHRLWEALVLGCIPIVKTSGIDALYKGLPVLILQSWSDLNLNLLSTTVNTFKNTSFQYEKLELSYWIEQFRKHRVLDNH
jgi:hypothetical protein